MALGIILDLPQARVLETELLLENVARWIAELTPGARVYEPSDLLLSGQGVGLWEAPRGANGHWIKIIGGKIHHYQVVSPTNWNASPRDNRGQRGPIEEALIGAPADNPDMAPVPLQIVRSFDPCLACSVH